MSTHPDNFFMDKWLQRTTQLATLMAYSEALIKCVKNSISEPPSLAEIEIVQQIAFMEDKMAEISKTFGVG